MLTPENKTDKQAPSSDGKPKFVLSEDINAKAWNQLKPDGSLKSEEELQKRLDIVVKFSDPLTKEERAEIKEWAKKYDDAIVIDALHTTALEFPAFATEEQSKQAIIDSISMVDVLSMSVSNGDPKLGDDPATVAHKNKEWIDHHVDGIKTVETVKEMEHNHSHGVASAFFNVQGSGQVDSQDMEARVKAMRDVGIRVANIAYNTDNEYGTGGNSNINPNAKGLTEKGKKLVELYNKYQIIVDISHSSNAVAIDAAKHSKFPIISSHTNPDHFINIPRNLSDEAIIAVAKTGGVAAINFIGSWHNEEGDASPEALAKTVNYMADLITKNTDLNGRLHTGFGSDYIHTYRETLDFTIRNPEKFRPESGYCCISEMGFAIDAFGIARVLEEKYGWSEEEVRGFLGENMLRVIKAIFIE